jgi:hypothetical protein
MTRSKTTKFWMGLGSLVMLFMVLIGYALFRSKDLIFGVQVHVNSIKDGEVFTDPLIHVSGSAFHARELTINDRHISIDQNGNFNEPILLPNGSSTITLEAQDKFGNTKTKILQLFLKQS